MKASPCHPLTQGGAAAFTLIELLVVIAVMGILAAMLLPALAHSKERARRAECLGHLRQLGAAVYLYVDEHGYRLPAAERRPTTPVFTNHILPRICDLLSNYVAGNRAVFACPKDQAGYYLKEGSSYEWNYTLNGQRLEQLMRPDGILPIHEAPMMYDYENVHETSKAPAKNVLFADGRVDQL
ncbi:MAG: type II secretion system protein [Verrucomicrobiota bacterium]